ncbi:hypothetical protein [Foliimonas ilicis]|uniref:hypothetical protein n=1 Tax=Mesorhizobium sp. SB112 TaxID=3151853 RepID=UPI0032677359
MSPWLICSDASPDTTARIVRAWENRFAERRLSADPRRRAHPGEWRQLRHSRQSQELRLQPATGQQPDRPAGVRHRTSAASRRAERALSTSVLAGCLVPVSFPTVATGALKRGTSLVVTTAAMSRAAELAK